MARRTVALLLSCVSVVPALRPAPRPLFRPHPPRPLLLARSTQCSGDASKGNELDGTTVTQLVILATSGMLVQAAIGAVVPVLPAYAESLGLSATGVGLIVSLPSVAKLVLNLPVGALVDSWGRKRPMIIGALVDGLGSFATASAGSLASLVPARLAVGAGSSFLTTAEQAYVMDVVDRFPEKTGVLLGSVQAVGLLGFALGPAVGGLLADRGGIRLPYVLIGSVLIGSAGLFACLPETKPRRDAAAADAAPAPTLRSLLPSLLADPSQRALCTSRFGLIVGWSVWLTVLPLQAAAAWGASAADLGLMYSVLTLLGLAVAPIGGLASDRYGSRRVATCGSLLAAVAVAILPLARSKAAFWLSMALWDCAEAVYTAAVSAFAAEVTPSDRRGSSNSLLNQVQDVAFAAMPLLLGVLASKLSRAAALCFAATLMLGSSASFLLLSRPPRLSPE